MMMLVLMSPREAVVHATARTAFSALFQGSAAADTLRTLDTNKNGKVDRTEIENFARSQGLSGQDVMGDFRELDTNDDDELDFSEISAILKDGADAQTDSVAVAAAPAPAVAATPFLAAIASKAPVPQPASTASKAKASGQVSSQAKKVQEISADGIEAAQGHAEQQAERVIASSFASRAQKLLRQSAVDEKSSETYAKEARALRGKIHDLVLSAQEATKHAAESIAAKVGQDAAPKIKQLQSQAQQLQHDAAQQRSLAQQAMQRVVKAQALMSNALQHPAV
jgi:hypothetical protein